VPLLYIWFFAKKTRKSLKTRKIPKKSSRSSKIDEQNVKTYNISRKRIIFQREQISQKKYRKSIDNKENIKIRVQRLRPVAVDLVKLIQKRKSQEILFDSTMEKSRISFYLQILH